MLKKIQIENILLDIFLVTFNLYMVDSLVEIQLNHLGVSMIVGALLHLPIMSIAYYKYSYIDQKEFPRFKPFRLFMQVFTGLGLVLGFVSFIWLLSPLMAYEKLYATEIKLSGLYFVIMLFLSLIFGALGGSMIGGGKSASLTNKVLVLLLPVLFLPFSESLIILSADILGSSDKYLIYSAIFWITMTFLPVRFFLFASPPVSMLEFFSMMASYVTFVKKILH